MAISYETKATALLPIPGGRVRQ